VWECSNCREFLVLVWLDDTETGDDGFPVETVGWREIVSDDNDCKDARFFLLLLFLLRLLLLLRAAVVVVVEAGGTPLSLSPSSSSSAEQRSMTSNNPVEDSIVMV